MSKEKISYKVILMRICLALFALSSLIGIGKNIYNTFNKYNNGISPEQQILEKDQKIKELETALEHERSKNKESNFMSELLNGKFQGNYVSSTLSEDDYTFDLEFMDSLKAKLKIRCKYEVTDSDIEIGGIIYPEQKMQMVDQNANQGYVHLEGVEITTPKIFNQAEQEISNESFKFSILTDKELQTFDMKVWIKDGEMTGFLFDKDGKEFARISGKKIIKDKENANKEK